MSETVPSGSSPSTAQAEPTVTPAAAPAAASSSTVQNDIDARVRAASNPREVRALIEELRKNPLKPKQPDAPAQQVTQPPEPTPEPATGETPAAEPVETPEAAPETEQPEAAQVEPEATPEAPEAPESEEADAPEADGPVTPVKAKKARITLPDDDEIGRLALSYQRRNRDWTLSQAIEAAQKHLGITPDGKPDPAKVSELPATIDDVDAKISQLEEDNAKALADVRFEDVAKLQKQIRQLERHRIGLERQAERKQQEAAAKYDADFSRSEAKAIELYPGAADPKSPLGKKMLEIEKALEDNEDPLFSSPNKPLRIAQMAAAELNIAPKRAGSTPAPAKAAAAPVTPAPKKGVVPGGASRTVPPTTNPQQAVAAKIQSMTPAEYRVFRKQLGLQSY